ncbi:MULTISPECIES: hypothetical protein [Myroides]|uniref:Polyketide cyclase n=1 Tax=Myroides albus TaxID=2562892 RepID=A0A6I3LMQ9_9FLAO|nr:MULTISPECIES: hypothetical protein [Myroides]MTG98600.1 hypothetical protein [Myroides albus]MVX35870.1 hypothetical protein [Myroides sp. LoEW2-1]UVD79970.1 hypothetical protein NWE55_01370 [Myroides albus]
MKIFKYFLLLILLGAISLTVFILTQSPTFKVEQKFTVDAPKEVVYEYIENLDLWSDWIDIQKQGNGIYDISIDNIGSFPIKEEYKHPYDSLSQDILYDDKISNIFWSFKNNKNKTDINFTFQGRLDLKTKLITFFQGNPNQVVSSSIEKNINNLIVYFLKQYKDYKIEVRGKKRIKNTNYISFYKESTLGTLNIDINKAYTNIKHFLDQNNIEVVDKPFLILQKDINRDHLTYEFAIPIKETLFLTENDLFKFGVLQSQDYFDTSLEGYYSHLGEVFLKTNVELNKLDYNRDRSKNLIIFLENSVIDTRFPAQWKTVIKTPVVKAPENINTAY